ncbi:protein croquemort-like [Bombyx mandarina]|uniref:Protein croquemort-like n=1 Tax=Bombyx mandarina TaxID=7092 RepID=A0A6J2JP27_BOMMA|nr:protein croquemort-like [Bombyx mandarina]
MKMVSSGVKSGLFMGFGSALVLIGAIVVVYWPSLFMAQLQRMMILSPTSTSFGIWQETPIPMYLECYMFNITNADKILAKEDVILKVEQFGPYVFRESHSKVNLTWNDNSTITFYNQRFWHFDQNLSKGSLSDEIISINPIIATVAYIVRHQPRVVKVSVDVFLRMFHDDLFLKANVSSWLFEGIEDPVLEMAQKFPDLPLNIPYDKFGWFYERNGSREFDGSFIMNTGAADFSRLGNIELWKYSPRTVFRDHCGDVKGSTGELWAPELGQPELFVFASDICTYLTLHKKEDVLIENIEGVRYAANDSLFDNGHNYPAMACYCDEVRDRDCVPPGALNVSLCRLGAPAFVSQPHFLDADPYYPSKIQGLDPQEEHRFSLALEMFTGMPLAVSAQLQINLLIRDVWGISINNVLPDPDTMVPMFWFRQELQVTPDYAHMARVALALRYYTPYALYALTVIGVVLILVGVVVLIRRLLNSSDTTPLIEESASQENHQ